MPKRDDNISWEEYFMGIAIFASKRSKDPNTQVGACIVDNEHNILSLGYNGAPIGYPDDILPWEREGLPENTKYPYVCHAELNAILNAARNGVTLKNSTLYVTLFPCNECAKAIIQSGIKNVIYLEDKYHDLPMTCISKKLLSISKINFTPYTKTLRNIILNL